MVDKQRSEEVRARKAKALRENLRKRKAAARKAKDGEPTNAKTNDR